MFVALHPRRRPVVLSRLEPRNRRLCARPRIEVGEISAGEHQPHELSHTFDEFIAQRILETIKRKLDGPCALSTLTSLIAARTSFGQKGSSTSLMVLWGDAGEA